MFPRNLNSSLHLQYLGRSARAPIISLGRVRRRDKYASLRLRFVQLFATDEQKWLCDFEEKPARNL